MDDGSVDGTDRLSGKTEIPLFLRFHYLAGREGALLAKNLGIGRPG